jgi:cytochrome c
MIIAFSGLTINGLHAQTTSKKTVSKTVKTITSKGPVTKKPGAAEIAQGKDMISKSDCLTCHKLDVKIIGPAYNDVATKYPTTEANYLMLSQKIIKGSSGVWGPIAMPPHPALAEADVKKMVQYILSLKAPVVSKKS